MASTTSTPTPTPTAAAPGQERFDPLLGPNSSLPSSDVAGQETTTTTTSSKVFVLVVANLIAYLVNVLITYGVGVFGGKTNQELSRKYQTLVTPVGWAFSIWGIIFLAQAIWVVYGCVVVLSREQNSRNASAIRWIEAVGFLYVWVVLAQAAWTFAFSYEVIWLSACFMASICGLLWYTVWSLVLEKTRQCQQQQLACISTPTYMLWIFPFTIHAGWITAATGVNVNVVLVAENASAHAQYMVAVGCLLLLFWVAFWSALKPVDRIVIPCTIAWALFGVFFELRNTSDESILGRFSEHELQVARIGSVSMAGLIVVMALLWRRT